MSKITAFRLAVLSAALSVLFAYMRAYTDLGAALLLLLVFDGIWAAKAERDRRLSKLHRHVTPQPPNAAPSYRLFIPRPLE